MWTSDSFDGPIFVDSLKKVIIPHWKNVEGVKCLIGDNLVSHLSMEVLELCDKHSIRFCTCSNHWMLACLPVSKSHGGKLCLNGNLARRILTVLCLRLCFQLSLALDEITDISANILSGYRKCGIIPLNRDGPCHNSLAQLMHLHQGAHWMLRYRNHL